LLTIDGSKANNEEFERLSKNGWQVGGVFEFKEHEKQ